MSNQPDQHSVASTMCYNCVFAQYNDKDYQIDCNANRLEKFEDAGVTVDRVHVIDEDHKKSPDDPAKLLNACAIRGKVCVYYRPSEFLDSRYKEKSHTEILDQVKQELRIPYHTILFFRQTDTLESLKLRISELEKEMSSIFS